MRRAPSWLVWALLGLSAALCVCLAVQDSRHQRSMEAARKAAAAAERAALEEAGWATPEEVTRLTDKIATGKANLKDFQGLLQEGTARYEQALKRLGIERTRHGKTRRELLAARAALDFWAKTQLPSRDWGAPEPVEGECCECPALFETPLTPRTLVLDVVSESGAMALLGRTDIYADVPERVKISEHDIDLDLTRWLVDPDASEETCDCDADWFAGGGVLLGCGGWGAAGNIVAPAWTPRIWRWEPRIRPWAAAGASGDDAAIMLGAGTHF